jgi:hypothetical protein
VAPGPHRRIADDAAVAEADHARRVFGDVVFVRDQENRDALLLVQPLEVPITSMLVAVGLPVGSSRGGDGALMSARAIATRCCCRGS